MANPLNRMKNAKHQAKEKVKYWCKDVSEKFAHLVLK